MRSHLYAGALLTFFLSAAVHAQAIPSSTAVALPPAINPPPALASPGGASIPANASINAGAASSSNPAIGQPVVTLDLVSLPDPDNAPPSGEPVSARPASPGAANTPWLSIAPAPDGPLATFGVPAATPSSSETWWRVPVSTPFYVTAEAMVLHRDNRTADQPIVINGVNGATVMSTRDLGFTNWAAGARIIAGYRLRSGAALELTYFGFQDFSTSASAANPFMLSSPAGLGIYTYDFHDANSMNVSYSSQLQNVELNYCLPSSRPISFLAGFRYLSWNESFGIQSNSSYYTTPEYSNYLVQTYNNLFGAQVGVRTQFEWRRLRVDILKKIGLFGNDFWQRSLMQDYGNTFVLEDNWVSHAGVAVVGDLGVNLGYRITDALAVRAGYNLIWLDGLALAPNELDFHLGQNSGTGHDHGGSVFMQGVNIGFDLRW